MTDPHIQTVRATFDSYAQDYDALRRGLVPRFDDFYGTVLELLDHALGNAIFHCLDLGTGTGLLAGMVLQRFPGATVLGLDMAEAMLQGAKTRLEPFGDRARLATADYAASPLPTEPGSCQAVVSGLSIHHLDGEQKRRLFGRIFAALAPGGIFINADQSLGPTPELETAYQQRWEADVRAAGVSEADLDAARKRAALDRSSTLEDQLAWLRQAGFTAADVAWKRYRFTVFHAVKGR